MPYTVCASPAIRRARIRSLLVAGVLCGAALLTGCSDDNPTDPSTPAVNSDPPNANARILSQAVFGDTSKSSSLWQIVLDGGPGYFFRGYLDSYRAVGRLSAAGNLLWFYRTGYYPNQPLTLPASAVVPGGLVVVGAHDTDGDYGSEVGFLSLFTPGGSLAAQAEFSSDSSDVWLNAVVLASDSALIVAGGERTPSRTNPYLAMVVLTPAGELEKRHAVVVDEISDRACSRLALDPATAGGPTLDLYLETFDDREGSIKEDRVHQVSVTFAQPSSSSVGWTQQFASRGGAVWIDDLCLAGGRLYVAGGVEDAGKEPRPSGGGYWDAGLAARLTLAGEVEWTSVVSVTKHSDRFNAVVPAGDAVYLVGVGANYVITETEETFGYGWVATLGAADGAVRSHSTFGDEACYQGFNTALEEGGSLVCGGWAREEVDGGRYQAWFCRAGMAGAGSAGGAAVAAPSRDAARGLSAIAHRTPTGLAEGDRRR